MIVEVLPKVTLNDMLPSFFGYRYVGPRAMDSIPIMIPFTM